MKILTNVTMAGNVDMSSQNKDTFTIGSELERDNPNADELKVWANANFYNDVLIGSSSADRLTIRAGTIDLSGSSLLNTATKNIYVSPNGSDTNTGGEGQPLRTIQAAVDKVALYNDTVTSDLDSHVVIYLASGSYEEKVKIIGKGISGKKSNNLLTIYGSYQVVHTPTFTGKIDHDYDSPLTTSSGFGSYLSFSSGIYPEPNSLVGCFMQNVYGQVGVITYHSGSEFYSSGLLAYEATGSGAIFRPTSEVNGYFKCANNNGVITFANIKLNPAKDFVGQYETYTFTGFIKPINGSKDLQPAGVSENNGSIEVYYSQILKNQGGQMVFGPRTYFFASYVSSSHPNLSFGNIGTSTNFSFVNGHTINVENYFSNMNVVDFGGSVLRNMVGNMANIPSITGPKKFVADIENNIYQSQFFRVKNANITFNPNSVIKSFNLIGVRSNYYFDVPSYFIGPFNSFIDASESTLEFGYGESGGGSGLHYFSGTFDGFRFCTLRDGSKLTNAGLINISNVRPNYNRGQLYNTEPLFFVNNSDIIHYYALPIIAASGSSNYNLYDVRLEDIENYNYTDFPIVNQQNSKLIYSQNFANLKADYPVPITAKNLTLSEFLVVTGNVTTLGNFSGSGTNITNILNNHVKFDYVYTTASSYTIDLNDGLPNMFYVDDNSSNIYLPDAIANNYKIVTIKNIGTQTITVYPSGSQTINGNASHNVTKDNTEMFHAMSGSFGYRWQTLLS